MQAVGCLLFGIFGVAQLWAAWLGADYLTGPFLAFLIIAGSLFLRFTLPVTICSFVGAMYVWDWPWWGALLFAAPGLLIVIPSVLATVLDLVGAVWAKRR